MPDTATAPTMSFAQLAAAGSRLLGYYEGGGGAKVDALVDTSMLAKLDAAGNLGVGTSTPGSLLHVSSPNATIITVASTSVGANDTQIRFLTPDRDWRIGQNVGGIGVGALVFYDVTAGGPRLVIDGGGIIRPGADNTQSLGAGSFRFTTIYLGSSPVVTSDRDAKEQIGSIPDEWLDAWAGVEWSRFKAKGGTRWHVGLVAQQVHDAFAAHGIDAFKIGLCCFDEWAATDAVDEVLDKYGAVVTPFQPARPAGSGWGLRYAECEAMEAAYHRRELAMLKAAVAALTAS